MPQGFQDFLKATKTFFKKNRQQVKTFIFGLNVTLGVVKRLALFLVIFLLLGGSLALGVGTGYFASLVADTTPPTKEELQKELSDYEEVSQITYAGGENLATISSDLIRTFVPSEEISPYLKQAIIATEDENFEDHPGVVPKALARAVISDLTGLGGSSGGSTLTQQLVKQQILTSETTFKRKANEILLALRVDKYFSKDEIITSYLNISPFGRNNKGQNIAGVEEAAEGIFGVKAAELTLPQAAFIAGLPQSPIVYSPYLNNGALREDQSAGLGRKDIVLFSMLREKIITQAEYDEAKAVDLTSQFLPTAHATETQRGFLYFTVQKQVLEILMAQNYTKDKLTQQQVIDDEALYNQYYEQAQRQLSKEGYTVQTTVDASIQQTLDTAVSDYGYILDDGRGAYVENGGVLMDNHTGRIYGFIGGRDFATSQNNHAFDTKRAPGSTIKPVLAYGPAVDIGLIGTQTMLSNFQTFYKEEPETEIWNAGVPPDNTFRSSLDALTKSLNIPTYHLYQEVLQNTDPGEYMKKMEYDVPESEYYLESSAFGQMDMTVYDQTKGYATLANGGVYNRGYLIEKITTNDGEVIYQHEAAPVEVYSKAAASILNEMMKNVVKNGTGRTAYWTLGEVNSTLANADWAGKTGTTTDNKDFWFIASTPGITFSSWAGYDDGTSMASGTATSNQKYWAYVINRVYQTNATIFEADTKFTLDPSVKQVPVSNVTGTKIANFSYEGKTYVTPGTPVNSLYATGDAPATSYEFAIGGTKENYAVAWKDKLKLYQVEIPKVPTIPSSSSSPSTSSDAAKEETTPSVENPAAETPAAEVTQP
ncbi:transglycosylase domain-containing protein [Enterococcus timonensis]|uniref:transglycosylase domain-containing protein n=1 Tax=Enterococcus timonensis TaxID=1852364 RepID=UPI0008DAEC35|nr:transglycosylase domain-containing protein [Enterococcus timonensis]